MAEVMGFFFLDVIKFLNHLIFESIKRELLLGGPDVIR